MGASGQRQSPTILSPGKTQYSLHRRLRGPRDRYGRVRKITPPPGFDPRTVQPVASRYIDCAIPALDHNISQINPLHILAYSLYLRSSFSAAFCSRTKLPSGHFEWSVTLFCTHLPTHPAKKTMNQHTTRTQKINLALVIIQSQHYEVNNTRVVARMSARIWNSLCYSNQTRYGAQPASYLRGIGSPFHWGKRAGTWSWPETSI
jgi:hypothetical protein